MNKVLLTSWWFNILATNSPKYFINNYCTILLTRISFLKCNSNIISSHMIHGYINPTELKEILVEIHGQQFYWVILALLRVSLIGSDF